MAKLKVLREGQTNINSTDIWRFSLHSDYPTFKVLSSGQLTLSTLTAGGSLGYYAQTAVAHNLDYKPITFVYADFSPYPQYPGDLAIKTSDVSGWYIFYYNDSIIYVTQWSDSTNTYFRIETPEYNKSLTFYYTITADKWL